ncbi:MAG: ABC transporter permease [Hyphomonadaceae bacterium]|nr:ABC transporter permease [Hyphomonadaceae bacterium]
MGPVDYRSGLRAATSLAFSRIRQRHLRSVLGIAWFFLTPAAIFLLYWFVFGVAFKVQWRQPDGAGGMGYVAPFALGYAFFLFLSTAISGATNALARVAGQVRRGGVPMAVATGSFIVEFLLHLALYLAIALTVVTFSIGGVTAMGVGAFLGALALFVLQTLALSILLMFVTPFVDDVAEGARLGLRLFVYAAGVTVPLQVFPDQVRAFIEFAPLSGPLNGARDALMFSAAPSMLAWGAWAAATAVLCALAAGAYSRLRSAALETL